MKKQLVFAILALALILSACNLPSGPVPNFRKTATPTIDDGYTDPLPTNTNPLADAANFASQTAAPLPIWTITPVGYIKPTGTPVVLSTHEWGLTMQSQWRFVGNLKMNESIITPGGTYIFVNGLIGNAIKFIPNEGTEIEISLTQVVYHGNFRFTYSNTTGTTLVDANKLVLEGGYIFPAQ